MKRQKSEAVDVSWDGTSSTNGALHNCAFVHVSSLSEFKWMSSKQWLIIQIWNTFKLYIHLKCKLWGFHMDESFICPFSIPAGFMFSTYKIISSKTRLVKEDRVHSDNVLFWPFCSCHVQTRQSAFRFILLCSFLLFLNTKHILCEHLLIQIQIEQPCCFWMLFLWLLIQMTNYRLIHEYVSHVSHIVTWVAHNMVNNACAVKWS